MSVSFRKSILHRFLIAVLTASCATTLAATISTPASHLLVPVDVQLAGQTNALAVAVDHPVFTWTLMAASPALHSVRQTSFQVQVFAGSQPSVLWDSGIVHSNAAEARYEGPALDGMRSYSVRVRAWDEQDHPTSWSAAVHWTQAPDWHPQWIATGDNADTDPLPIFRKSFDVHRRVVRALLYATGLGQDEVRLNGRKIGNDELTPGWSEYHKTIYYDAYDVTSLVQPGANAIGVLIGNGMYRVLKTEGRYTKFTGTYGSPKCALMLHLDLAGGQTVDISTDATWKTHPGPIVFSSTYGGEDFDARREPLGWDRPGLDDAQWQSATPANEPGGKLQPEIAPPLRALHTYSPVKVTHPKSGIAVYDLGQNFAGWPEMTAAGTAGTSIKLISGELLNPDGTVSQRSSGSPQWFSYTLRGNGTESWHPRFSYYGFRYVQVETTGTARVVSLRGQAVHSSSEATGKFESSDDQLNRIHTLIVRAIENNSVSLFTDCPHREKLGWLEETHLLASAMLYDFDFRGLYAATARNIADAQNPDGPTAGRVPEIAPQYVVFGVDNGVFDDSPEWGSAAVLAPWYVYQRTGDRTFLAAQLEVMRHYVAYLATRANNGIVAYGLGDWYDIGPGEPGISKLTTAGVTATATYYQDIRVLEKTAALLGMTDESRRYAQQADAVRDSFNARFFDTAQHRYDKGSQTAQAMPLVVGLVPENQRAAVLNALVADIRAHRNHVTAGDVGFHYVVEALLDGGRSDVLYDMLQRTDSPSYGYQLAQGATALTEAWDADPESSQDHFMLGHAEEWFYRGLGGIDIDFAREPDQQLILRPEVVGNLRSVQTQYQSTWGLIQSNWKRGSLGVDYDFTIPPNATALIEVSAASDDAVTMNGASPAKAAGVQSSKSIGRSLQIKVGSGHYHVHAPSPHSTAS